MADKGTRGIVYYCPELRLYRYKYKTYDKAAGEAVEEAEIVDYKFDADELEDTLTAVLASGDEAKEANANFVANITGLARVNPHKIVEFDTGEGDEGKIEIKDPVEFWRANDEERRKREEAEERAGAPK
jgi:hypothetical protein